MTEKPPKSDFLKDQEEQESLSFKHYIKSEPERKNSRDEGTDTGFAFRPQLPSSSGKPSGEVKADPSPSSYSERPVEQGSTSQAPGLGTSSSPWSELQKEELHERLTRLQLQETSRQVAAENQPSKTAPNSLKRWWDSLWCQCGGPKAKTREKTPEEDTGPDPGEIDSGE